MAMPPGAEIPAAMYGRLSARYHLQLEILENQIDGLRGLVRARVMSFFRNEGTLQVGDEISFQVPVASDDPDFPNLDGDWDTTWGELSAARYMEVFLNRERGRCGIASGQFEFIEDLTEEPCMTVPARAEAEAAWQEYHGFPMPPIGPSSDSIEEEAVVELRDQDGMRTPVPSQYPGWLEDMRYGDHLTFVHQDGGQLMVHMVSEGLIARDDPLLAELGVSLKPLPRLFIQCMQADGEILAEATRNMRDVVQIIDQYIRGNTHEAVAQIRRKKS